MEIQHEILRDGESTEHWAMRQPDFFGSIKQLVNCARCGEVPPFKRHDEPRHVIHIGKPTFHFICDECYDQLPE